MELSFGALADRLDPDAAPARDTFAELGYEPNDRQAEFHRADEYDVLYGGAAGGGKTRALLMEGIRACDRWPGINVGAFRLTYPQLAASFEKELVDLGYARALGARWLAGRRELRFPNGSTLGLYHCRDMKDASDYQSAAWQLLLIDERTLFPPKVIAFLESRVRSGKASVPVLGIRSGTNPGGPGHGDCKKRYIVPTHHGRDVVYDTETDTTRRFIPARVADNPHIDAGYLMRLNRLPDALRKAMKDGSWDSFEGQVFTEWNRDRHVVRPFALAKEWRRICGVDYGFAAPWAVEWGAVDRDRRVWVYRELYKAGVVEKEQARQIKAAEKAGGDPSVVRAADPSMWNKVGEANPVSHTYSLEGVAVQKATNDRLAGWARIHTFLDEWPICPYHRALGEQGDPMWAGATTCPRLHVFETCTELIRTLPDLPYDESKVEDVDSDAEDHAPDALRYMAMLLTVADVPVKPREPETPSEKFNEHVAKKLKVRRRDARRAGQLGRI